VGVNWSQDGGQTFPYRGQSLQVSTLEEVFQRFPDYPMVIEIKQEEPDMTGPMCDLIREYGMEENVIIPSFSDATIQAFRAACPEVATAPAGNEVRSFVLLNFAFLSDLLKPDYQAFQVPVESGGITVITPRFIRAAHNRNLQVHVWTINDPAEMQRLIDLGVDGIMTDRPDVLLELLGR
jgi:glycerophosphoryl diester phosphodiesterase